MKRTYDVVIVGAGAAGCAMARRLRKDRPELSVALLDQGCGLPSSQWPRCVKVPFLQPFIASSRAASALTQVHEGEPEEALANRALTYVRGCGLGGSTRVNDMKYRRGTRRDLASWNAPADAWSFEALLPHFLDLEGNGRGDSRFHSGRGPLPVTDVLRSNRDSSLNIRFFEACESAGVNPTDDFNSGEDDGYTSLQSMVNRGQRVDVYEALLGTTSHSFSARTEKRATPAAVLDVMPDTAVTRIVFTGTRATGVEVRTSAKTVETIEAGLVVCTAGTLGTPVLLQRSGIGPDGAVAHVPEVGENLIQGTSVDLIFRIQNYVDVYSKSFSWRNARYLRQQWREYREERTGLFTSFAEAVAMVRSEPTRETPNLSISLFRTPQVGWEGWRQAGIVDGFTMRVCHHYPQSRGTVRYDAATDRMRIRSHILTAKEDVQCMDEGIQWAGLLTSNELKSVYYQDKRGNPVSPFWSYSPVIAHPKRGLATQKDTAAFLAQYARGTADLFGTCAMGTVVNVDLKVKGVEGLVVADASVVPTPTVASSSVLGAAIADRAATRLR